jgi:hypothetical protein
MFGNDLHRASNVASLHVFGPYQFGFAVQANQIDLDLSVTKHVHVRRLVVI